MLKTKRLLSISALLLIVVLPACTYHKSVTNEWVKHVDTSQIVVGESTHMDVLEKIGPPSPVFASERAVKNVASSHFIYSCWENRGVDFNIGYILVLPFGWTDQRVVESLVVEFDDKGLVSDIYRVKDDLIWRPLQGEGSRDPREVEFLGGRMAQ